ncbi:MAG TPA: type I secretion C-terminal target domain-containing protein [Allosphingosinicella sp.]|nr:type I secretion C-terminal target domain-containing protein [Allosphingosinicella sp.]
MAFDRFRIGGEAVTAAARAETMAVTAGSGELEGETRVGTNGPDRFDFTSHDNVPDSLTGLAGSDVFNLTWSPGSAADRVTDFAVGESGDVIDFAALIPHMLGYTDGTNPFTAGYLRISQDGADALLEIDQDAAGAGGWAPVLRLQGVSAAELSHENLTPRFTVDGAGIIVTGEVEDEIVHGTGDADTLDASAGNDYVYGDHGGDLISGGIGDDSLFGGGDRDVVAGGAGADLLEGNQGDDQLRGGGGDDRLHGGSEADQGDGGDDILEGGAGHDQIYGDAGNDRLRGGDGDDYLHDFQGTNSLYGEGGNDSFAGVSFGTGLDVLSGGTGRDSYLISWQRGDAADTIVDFSAGAAGDVLHIASLSGQMIGGGGDNPFTSGFLRLAQEGADTLLQMDADGAAMGAGWETVLTLRGVDAATLTRDNFVQAFSPTGIGVTIAGTDAGEWLAGSLDGDTISAGGGGDHVAGGRGSDAIDGDDGDDELSGEEGSDVVRGDSGRDILSGGDGDDRIEGGSQSDLLYGDNGDDQLIGGGGADYFQDVSGSNRAFGGAGADTFGWVSSGIGFDSLSGGTERDRYLLDWYDGDQADEIIDFAPGDAGDVIAIDAVLNHLEGYASGSNPFRGGFLQLVQEGSDTLLTVDADGAAGAAAAQSVLILRGVAASSLTAANFEPMHDPAGGPDIGTAESDVLWGTRGADQIGALAGDDYVYGGEAADLVDGGEGHDNLYGEAGADRLIGGSEHDRLFGGTGNDRLEGEAGHDSLAGDEGDDLLFGGDGDDSLVDMHGSNRQSGGAGRDTFELVSAGGGLDVLTGGPGSDEYRLNWSSGFTADRVTDFAGGAGGDVINLNNMTSGLQSFAYGSNPFLSGHMRLLQNGADTLLQIDRDGAAGAAGWETALTLANFAADAITAANLLPGYSPTGQGEHIVGTDADNMLTGTLNDDVLEALDGADMAQGGAGDDQLLGGAGNDYLDGSDGDDVVDAGAGDDTIFGGYGNDSLDGGGGNDVLNDVEGENSLSGGEGDDEIGGISYGIFHDRMSGGEGIDTFRLGWSPGSAADTVTDFAAGAGGDLLDIESLTWTLEGWYGVNPFTSGHLRLVQSGADTLLQRDGDAGGGLETWETVLTLQGVQRLAVTSANLSQGFDPTAVNRAPVARADQWIVSQGAAGSLQPATLLANDTDANGDLLSVTSVDSASGLAASVGRSGAISFVMTPDAEAGSFAYTISDGSGGLDTATVAVATVATTEVADTLAIASRAGTASFVDAGAGDDRLTGGSGWDRLLGGAGNDLLDGGSAADQLSGGGGDDSFVIDHVGDLVQESGGGGTDSVASSVSHTLAMFVENLTLTGTAAIEGTGNFHANVLTGNSGDNVIRGGLGNDRIDGGGGSDWLQGESGNDRYLIGEAGAVVEERAGDGNDSVYTAVSYSLAENIENLVLRGEQDIAGSGNELANAVRGNSGSNTLAGGAGDDVIEGRAGRDTLTGGAGADTFDYNLLHQSRGHASDLIMDFSSGEGDLIDLSTIDANPLVAGDQAFTYIGEAAFSGSPAELRAYEAGGITVVEADTDSDGLADLRIELAQPIALQVGDFVI